jgi:hypothetical protein
MNEEKNIWQTRIGERRNRGFFWGLLLVAIGGFSLLGNMEIVPEPARIILPSLVILWGIASLFSRRGEK